MECLDAGFFGMSPHEAAIMDPQHRQFLECAWEALEHAGHVPSRFRGPIGVFAGSGHNAYLPYNLLDRPDDNFFGLAVNFTPTWFQVLPGVDMLAPMTWSAGVAGNSAVTFGGNEDGGTWSFGLAADVRQRVRFDLKYVAFFGDYTKCPRKGSPPTGFCPTGAMDVNNGVAAAVSDRDFVALTIKTTF